MMSLSRFATRSRLRAFAISDSVIVFLIVSGMGKGSRLVVEAGTCSSGGFFFPNSRISSVRIAKGCTLPFLRKRSIPLIVCSRKAGARLL